MTRTKQLITGFLATLFVLLGSVATLSTAQAQGFTPGDPSGALEQAAPLSLGGDDPNQLFITIGTLIDVLLGLLGVIFFLLIVWAGFIWMTAQGDTTKVDKARTMLVQAVIGIIIILSAYAISNFALDALLTATNSGA